MTLIPILTTVHHTTLVPKTVSNFPSSSDFAAKADEVTNFFINRHYHKNIIKKALDLVKLIPRQQILHFKCVTADEDRLILSLLYHPSTIHVRKNHSKCERCPFICTLVEVQGPKCSMNVMKHFNCQTYM